MTREASRRLRQAIETAQSILSQGGTAAAAAAAAQRFGVPADGAASSGDSDDALSEAGEPCELNDAAAQLCIGTAAAPETPMGAGGGEVHSGASALNESLLTGDCAADGPSSSASRPCDAVSNR